nr:immunoglobulin light chain junction region [Macaca mulatta]
CMMWHNYAYIF